MITPEQMAALQVPFPPDHIEWVVQRKTKEGNKAWVSANVDMRHYMKRLNDVFGGEWSVEYEFVKPDGSVIRCDLNLGGTIRSDFSEQDPQAPNIVTQSIAQSFKRACVTFGLGMPLYFLPQSLAPINEYGNIMAAPDLPAWYWKLCGLTPEKKPAIVGKAEAILAKAAQVARGADMPSAAEWDNLHQPSDESPNEPEAPKKEHAPKPCPAHPEMMLVWTQSKKDPAKWYYGHDHAGGKCFGK